MQENVQSLLALSLVKGLGPVSLKRLVSHCGGAANIFQTPRTQLLKIPGIGNQTLDLLQSPTLLDQAQACVETCQQAGVQILPYTDPAYPHALKFIHNSPVILYKKGPLDLNERPSIAIVGTRKPTHYGLDTTEIFAQYFAQQGINVVSGLAYGIDFMAHKTVLREKGITTAVLGHGLDRIYPWAHESKAREIELTGALLTEYPPGTDPDPAHFPARNRIVAGISKAVVVIEAAEKGGALITAQMAFDQNREVYAIPGRLQDTRSTGCNHLIRDQIARLVTHPQEILQDLEIQWALPPTQQLELSFSEQLSPEECKVLNVLVQGEVYMDYLIAQTGIPVQQLNPLLLSMEFKGLISQSPGKKFRRKY